MNNQAVFADRRLGHVELAKGKKAEERTFEAILKFAYGLDWFKTVRFATKEEDTRGIDLVVETRDIGSLYVQVKSSWVAATRFKNHHPRMVVAVLVIHFYEYEEVVWKKVLPKLLEVRQEIFRRRNQQN
ncbi:MAG: hypothetical protein WCO10_01265 [bacterium]